ncbi:Transposon Ty3-I Gag-Pol polyprotein [Gossypium australe]|uniref:Transposon Ty3-I Gag-Pol polyprotein n=1 Tax=Gossypium australe TaxID=47621 RepID=A0A5B6X4D7_9ROSI|nr:Transposon Ty3-I Gag-Pol polyprotein [Gossypium australe]
MIKDCLTNAHLLSLPDFTKTFEIECDALGIEIGAVLTQNGYPIAYLSEKLNGATLNYLTFDKEMYTLIRLYETDVDFGEVYKACEKGAFEKFYKQDGYLFREGKLCIPQGSIREVIVNEAHSGGLMGNFGLTKTLAMLHEHLFWPKMRRDVERVSD